MSHFYSWAGLILYGATGFVVPHEWGAIIAVGMAGLGGFLVCLGYGVQLICCQRGQVR